MSETIEVNGKHYTPSKTELDVKLIDYLRETLGLKGTKKGCGIGACGACTVLIDGGPKRSCVLAIGDVLGKSVLTIEGLENSDGSLHPVQEAFIEAGGVQCGFCTPGMILTSYALIRKNSSPTRTEVRKALRNNLCRCTGYQQIVDAVILAAEKMDGKRRGDKNE